MAITKHMAYKSAEKLKFRKLTKRNFSRFEQKLLESEQEFPEPIRFSRKQIKEVVSEKDNIAKVVMLNSEKSAMVMER